MRKIIIFLSLFILSGNYLYSQTYNQIIVEHNNLKKNIQSLKKENKELDQKITDITAAHLKKIQKLTQNVSTLKESYLHNIYSASFGSIILIIGLLIEIIGATLLAGNNLSSKIKMVYSLTVKADLGDLAMNDVTKEHVMKFHGYLGSILLIFGFIFQMVGTIFVVGVPLYIKLIVIIGSLTVSTWILYYLIGQTPGQSRKEKVGVIWTNFKRLMLLPIIDRLTFTSKIRCDYCLKKTDKGIVAYLDEPNSEEHQFLYSPQLFHFCHSECIDKIDDYENIYQEKKDWHESISKVELK